MKQILTLTLSVALLCSGCASGRMTGTPEGVMAGASIGGQIGNVVGGVIGEHNHGWRGGYRGSAIGTIVGTLAGAVIGNVMTSPRERREEGADRPARRPARTEAAPTLRIRNIRFIDDGRNQTINSGERCKLIFEIMNEGDVPACNIVPVVSETSGMKRIHVSSSILIEEIAPHEGIKYTATVTAGSRIKTGNAVFHIGVADEYGEELDWQEFDIPTER